MCTARDSYISAGAAANGKRQQRRGAAPAFHASQELKQESRQIKTREKIKQNNKIP